MVRFLAILNKTKYFVAIAEANSMISLKDVLIFFTGTDREPPLGFDCQPKLTFADSTQLFATASTCELILRLPLRHSSYEDFKSYMEMSFKGNDYFGLV